MKEIVFLQQNKQKWNRFESLLESKKQADTKNMELQELFIEITDDLSFAQTHYPNSQTHKYLNDIAARVHQNIYQNKKEDKSRIITFWTYELPTLFYTYFKELLIAFLFFALTVFIGAISQYYDEDFARLVLSDSYVNTTLENIKNGDPTAIYKSGGQVEMFFSITINNTRVSFITFASGLLAGIGTIFFLIQNGIMLGCFQFFFYQQKVLMASMLSIWIHGTIEISSIVIAGCAGLVLSKGLLFPGTYSRIEALKKSAKDGIKIAVGLVPMFIIAGFLESFVTRYSNMPLWLSLSIIALSLVLILGYFIVYPIYLNYKNKVSKYILLGTPTYIFILGFVAQAIVVNLGFISDGRKLISVLSLILLQITALIAFNQYLKRKQFHGSQSN